MSFLSDPVSRFHPTLATSPIALTLTLIALMACATPMRANDEVNERVVANESSVSGVADGSQSDNRTRTKSSYTAAASFSHYAPDYAVKSAMMAVPSHGRFFASDTSLPSADAAGLPASFATGEGAGASGGGSTTAAYGEITGPITGFKAAWKRGEWDLYLSGYGYHIPAYYTEEQLDRLNSAMWGGGFGRSIADAKGNRHLIYIMASSDSHYKPQYFAGYAWQHPFFPESPFQVDFGISAFLFSRVDVADGFPLPGILPYLAFGTKKVQVMVVYVPPIGDEIAGQMVYFYARIAL